MICPEQVLLHYYLAAIVDYLALHVCMQPASAVGIPTTSNCLKLPAHCGVLSNTIYADIKHLSRLFFLAAGFCCCSPFQQRTVICEFTPK